MLQGNVSQVRIEMITKVQNLMSLPTCKILQYFRCPFIINNAFLQLCHSVPCMRICLLIVDSVRRKGKLKRKILFEFTFFLWPSKGSISYTDFSTSGDLFVIRRQLNETSEKILNTTSQFLCLTLTLKVGMFPWRIWVFSHSQSQHRKVRANRRRRESSYPCCWVIRAEQEEIENGDQETYGIYQ